MKLLNVKQLRAKRGGRSRSSTYRDVEAGRLPQPIKIGGRIYWDEDAVDDHLRKMIRQQAESDQVA